ncbi:hypothetical protein [Stenotrophomonas acidaminiphila]|uniref:hypothetical protein n=1 Tax=Stenotrophomonas acidaminiphila TaxID=128780 RepID=UPI0028A885F7|nr:hypothetical protein [Stenotrophomonas acidaminiphila]
MKRILLLVALLGVCSSASAFIVQDKDGTLWDCNYVTNSDDETRLICIPVVSMPPDPNP